jgi:hypothetical protein
MAFMALTTIPEIVEQNPGKPAYVAEYGTGKRMGKKNKRASKSEMRTRKIERGSNNENENKIEGTGGKQIL